MNSAKLNKLRDLFFYLTLLIFFIGFNFTDNPTGNWYQQFLPNIDGRSVNDITFLDSLRGYAVTSLLSDTSYILKTTNGGDNWMMNYVATSFIFNRIQFLSSSIGYAGGTNLIRTTDGGISWNTVNSFLYFQDFYFISNDTGWYVDPNSLVGGVFRTTNGGANWTQQLALGSQNPWRIYMYDGRIGFVATGAGPYKTTNSGTTWFPVPGRNFSDMYFIDTLTGWKASGYIEKTTDGGFNWINQPIPQGGNIMGNGAARFMNKDNDTIWAVGESIIIGGSPPTRGILFRTTNGGSTWQFQLPDTSIHINRYLFGQFVNKRIGWAYSFNPTGIHTTNGGDTTFITAVRQISSSTPNRFRLSQNYPNPFNISSKFKVQITSNVKRQTSNVKVIVYDVAGKEIIKLLDENLKPGEYEIDFNGSNYSSGIYFYSLIIDGNLIDTKKMILLK